MGGGGEIRCFGPGKPEPPTKYVHREVMYASGYISLKFKDEIWTGRIWKSLTYR